MAQKLLDFENPIDFEVIAAIYEMDVEPVINWRTRVAEIMHREAA